MWNRHPVLTMTYGRPESQGAPQDVYTAEEAVRYHAASASIQKDLTRLALELLQLPVSDSCMCCNLCS